MAFAKECWPFVLPALALAVLLLVLGQPRWAAATTLLALLLLLFFRIPARDAAESLAGVLAPANGKVLKIELIEDPAVGPGRFHRVVIFLSVFNIHVQRAPVGGTVIDSRYAAGRKLAAFDERAGEVNEQQLTVLQRPGGDRIAIRQIAGLLARRVVTYLEIGQDVRKGELMGVIKFGSRVDLLVPDSYQIEVAPGDKTVEGLTVLARRGPENS